MRAFNVKLIMLITSFFLFTIESKAQCAGNDNSITICSKETYNQGIGNPNGVLDLFPLLGIGAVPGGTWTNLNSSGGLNTSTGILNTWQINQSGIYNYQYTINGITGCTDNISIITVTLGGFPGVDNPSAVACDNNPAVPLFSFLGSSPNPHFNGTWTGGPAGSITGNFFNAQLAGIGTYTLTYSVPAIGSCPSRSANVTITVHPLPESGAPSNLTFCETDDFSAFTNVNLFDQLSGEDSGGFWSDNFPTGEISNAGDSFINIQNIANNFGPGTYTFTYNVNPSHPICAPASSNVAIIIEPVIDINGATLSVNPNVCFDDLNSSVIVGTITQGVNPIPNDTYNISYTVSGANSGTETVSITFSGGIGSFIINSSFISSIGISTVAITTVINPTSTINCTRTITNLNSTFEVYENPNISDSQIEVNTICLGQNGLVTLTDSNNSTIELSNGTYTITYDITGPNGTITGQTATINITGGSGTFSIINSLTPVAGNYSINITNIQNQATGCNTIAALSTSFEVLPIPDAQSISISISDICVGNSVLVSISGASNLPDGFYTLEYDISGAISASNQTENNVQFTAGNATFTLPNGILAIGTSTLTLTNLFSATNTCNTTTFNNPSDTFVIADLPNTNNINLTVNSICIGNTASVTISAPFLTDGSYNIYYTITGANTFTGFSNVSFLNGNGILMLSDAQLINNGTYTFTLTTVENSSTLCTSTSNESVTFSVSALPELLVSEVSIQDICLGNNASVQIISLGGLDDGNYQFTYSLFGVNGPSNPTIPVSIVGGNGNFSIPASSLTNIGLTSITIDTILNIDTGCSNNFTTIQVDFNVNELPDFTLNTTTISDVCLQQDAAGIILNASNLSNGNYIFTYDLSGANTASNESFATTIDQGAGSFIISGSLLGNPGTTTATLTGITNTDTGCSTNGLLIPVNFEVIPLPNTTGATLMANPICINEVETITINNASGLSDGDYSIIYELSNANTSTGNSATVSIINGSGSFVIPSTLLSNGGTTTITIQNLIYNASQCGSSTLTISPISFEITNPNTPTLINDGNLFCVQDQPTVGNLTSNTTSSGTIIWYDAPVGGNSYNETDLLSNGTTYYGATTLTNGCESNTRLQVVVDLTNCNDLFIPDGFSPNNDGLNETFYIKDLDILYPNFVLEIYNRYGNIIYKGDINTPDFDGKSNQSTVMGTDILPTGVYFYILYYNDSTSKEPSQGRLYLSR